MGSTPQDTTFSRDDFPSEGINSREALDALIAPLNQRLAQDKGLLAGGITLANTGFEIKTVQVQTPADDWVTITSFGSGNYSALASFEPKVRKDGTGRVYLDNGAFAVGASVPTNNQTIASLPSSPSVAAWAPDTPAAQILPAVTRDGSANDVFASIAVLSDGTLKTRFLGTWYANSFISASGSWMAKDRTPIPLSCFPFPFTLSKVTNPSAVVLVGVRDITSAANGGNSDASPIAIGTAKTRMLDASKVQVQNVPGLLLGRRYELTFLALV